MKVSKAAIALGLWMLCGVPLFAHHAFESEFDLNKAVHLEGKVTQVEWGNPHVYFEVVVPDPRGASVNWRVEATSVNDMFRVGVNKLTIAVGSEVSVEGFVAKSGDRLVGAMALTLKTTSKTFDLTDAWKRWAVPVR